ncbi:hypothetical protein MN116_009096 [Schistosoma mekongi]|uniref:Uncharacterized protein n=1 Tax=Schistosoma mekongi TaxID=38744 RepID=A0AAE1Z4S3_SCHME|nr:hypothetical protein MN116_009096 [Schistosoma mekongi]
MREFVFSEAMNKDGHTSSMKDKILSLTVHPGWREGTRITFPKEGNQGQNMMLGEGFVLI